MKVAALAMGTAEKAVSLFYEQRLHQEVSDIWVSRCRAQIADALSILEADRAGRAGEHWFGGRLGHADIAVAVVLRFLGEAHPGLVPVAAIRRSPPMRPGWSSCRHSRRYRSPSSRRPERPSVNATGAAVRRRFLRFRCSRIQTSAARRFSKPPPADSRQRISKRSLRRREAQPARAASFSTVFQLRPVPLVPSFFSITAMVSFERPMPSG